MMDKKNCSYCGKKLRPCKRIDFQGRNEHFSCIEKQRREKYERELHDFLEFFKSHGILVRID